MKYAVLLAAITQAKAVQPNIAVAVQAGKFQVQDANRKAAAPTPLTEWLTMPETVDYLVELANESYQDFLGAARG